MRDLDFATDPARQFITIVGEYVQGTLCYGAEACKANRNRFQNLSLESFCHCRFNAKEAFDITKCLTYPMFIFN